MKKKTGINFDREKFENYLEEKKNLKIKIIEKK
jgi:hypothetical protein